MAYYAPGTLISVLDSYSKQIQATCISQYPILFTPVSCFSFHIVNKSLNNHAVFGHMVEEG